MDTFLTWEYVATFAGLVFATNLFVNFTKDLPAIKSMPTKYYTSIVAFILIVCTNLTSGTFDYKNLPLMILNSIIITFTATGSYDFTNKTIKSETGTNSINILPTIDNETK